jgi:polyisoprenoid-binding protein YceI
MDVEGDLTLHGVTRRITAPVEAEAAGSGWLMKGATVVRLTDYGVPDPSIVLNKVSDEVEIRFEIRFTARAE